jgi:tetratricopeptide (TPR) repeat protein
MARSMDNSAGAWLESGISKYNSGDYLNAIRDFSRALRSQKNNPNALLFRALSLQMVGKAPDALRDMRLALKLDPTDASLHLAAVGVFKTAGQAKLALKHATLAAKLNARSGDTWGVKAELELEAGLESAARDSFERAMQLGLNSQMLRERAAVFFQEQGDALVRRYLYSDAERDFKKSLAANRKWRKSHLGYGELCRVRGRTQEAIRHLENAAKLPPVDPIPFLKLGELYLREHRLGLAERALRLAAEAGSMVHARLLLGRLLERRGQSSEAQAQFRAAATASAGQDNAEQAELGRLEAHIRLARFKDAFVVAEKLFTQEPTQDGLWKLFRAMGLPENMPKRRPKMAADLTLYTKKNPKDMWGHLLLAYLLDRIGDSAGAKVAADNLQKAPKAKRWMLYIRGELALLNDCDYKGAARDLRAAYQCAPGMWNAKALSAETLLCQGEDTRAMKAMELLVKRLAAPVAEEAVAWRGCFHLWRGRYKQALKDFNVGVRGGARFARTWRGATYCCLGEFDKALVDLQQAVAVDRSDTEAWIWKAETLSAMGRRDEALKILEHADCRSYYWANALRALLHFSRGAQAQGHQAVDDLLPVAREQIIKLTPLATGGEADAEYWKRALTKAFKKARGMRRGNEHLLPLWTVDKANTLFPL